MRLYKQKFYRMMTGGRKRQRQDIEVEVEVNDDDNIAVCKRKAKKALYELPDTGFKSGWTVWFRGKHQIVELEDDSAEQQAAEAAAEAAVLEDQMREDMEGAGLDPDTPDTGAAEVVAEIVALDPSKGEVPPHVRGEAIERLKPFSRFKIKNVYDRPEFPVDAVKVLQPGFEYPDWEDERVNKLWKR